MRRLDDEAIAGFRAMRDALGRVQTPAATAYQASRERFDHRALYDVATRVAETAPANLHELAPELAEAVDVLRRVLYP